LYLHCPIALSKGKYIRCIIKGLIKEDDEDLKGFQEWFSWQFNMLWAYVMFFVDVVGFMLMGMSTHICGSSKGN